LPFHQGVTDFGPHFPNDRVYCTVQNRIAEAGDILFSVRAPVGRINVTRKRIVIGRGLCAVRNRQGNQAFTLHQLKERFAEEDTIGDGTIFKAVTKEDTHGIGFLQPSGEIIRSYENRCHPMDKLIESLTQKDVNLRATRDLLLPKLISGEVDVSSLDIEVEGAG
jgi:type I restriction enzyme S subunit